VKTLAVDGVDTKLSLDYEDIRRQEYELITDLLDILPRIDNLGTERLEQVRDALFHADHPFLAVFIGPFSSGKTSILNALLGESDLLAVGPIPTTDRIHILRWGEEPDRMNSGGDVDTVFYPSPLLKKISFVDTPGLESVFQHHEEVTRRFLHRSDLVFLVMLATQAMTSRNLDYLKQIKSYGKKVIILINQADLLSEDERKSVREYVIDQSKAHLGFEPEVWLVSAKEGLEARVGEELDKAKWEASGLQKIEEYVDKQLSDASRLRQKLQTPLQITQNVTQAALTVVRRNQSSLDHYQALNENINRQLDVDKRELEKIVREINDEIAKQFTEASERGGRAIRSLLRVSRALPSIGRGILSLVGLSRLLKNIQGGSAIRLAFEHEKAFEPIYTLPAISDKLGPRLEGKDIQDIDDLVEYARREVKKLPPSIQEKVIGQIQPPTRYDREALTALRAELEPIEEEAREVETQYIEHAFQNTLLYVAVWEILLVIFGVALISTWDGVAQSRPELPVALLIGLLALGLLGVLFMPIRGRILANAYANRLLKLQNRYIETITKAADTQIIYGMQLRREAIAPLTRLVTAQAELHNDQLKKLQAAEQEMVKIEAALNALGKKRIPGL